MTPSPRDASSDIYTTTRISAMQDGDIMDLEISTERSAIRDETKIPSAPQSPIPPPPPPVDVVRLSQPVVVCRAPPLPAPIPHVVQRSSSLSPLNRQNSHQQNQNFHHRKQSSLLSDVSMSDMPSKMHLSDSNASLSSTMSTPKHQSVNADEKSSSPSAQNVPNHKETPKRTASNRSSNFAKIPPIHILMQQCFGNTVYTCRSLFFWLFLLIVVGAILPGFIFIIWLPSFVAQTVSLSNMVHESRAASAYQLVHNTMKLPRMFLHGFSSYTATNTVAFGNSTEAMERRWNVIWSAFSKSMHEWDYHVHYTYFELPQDSDATYARMLGVMGGSWTRHQIKPEYAIAPASDSGPEHNAGFDHSKILRYHAGWGEHSPNRLLGQNVINATTGAVTSWATLNVTYDGSLEHLNHVKSTSDKTGWVSTDLWHCQSLSHDCMQMTGYFEKEFDAQGELRGWHYIAYETTGFYTQFGQISQGNGVTFLMERTTKKLLASGTPDKIYYQKSDGTLAIHTYDSYPDTLVNAAGRKLLEAVDHSLVNVPQRSLLVHNSKRYHLDLYYYEDGFGIEWYIVSVTDEVASVAVPVVLGTVTGVIALVFVVVFTFCGCMACLTVRRNMTNIIKNLRHIELMQLNKVKLRKPYNSEFAQITAALYHLQSRMYEYRAFLPNSLLDASSSGSEINEVTTDEDTTSSHSEEADDKALQDLKNKRASVQKYLGSRTELDQLGNAQVNSFRNTNNNRNSLNAQMDPRFECNLQEKPMTLLVVEIHNVDIVLECLDWAQYTLQHGEYLASLTKISSAHKGSLDYFSHKYYGYYFKNPLLAAKAALKMEKRLNQLNQVGKEDYSNVPFLFSIGLATGPTYIGTLGNALMKNKIIFGESKKKAELLSRANRVWQTSVLCDETTRNAIRDVVHTRPVTQIELPHSYLLVDGFEVIEVISHVQDEWMYEMQHEEKNKRFELFEEGYQFFVQEKYAEALNLFMTFYKENPKDNVVGKMIKKCTAQMIQSRQQK